MRRAFRRYRELDDTKAFALVVDAKDDKAVAFYEHHGFLRFGGKPQSLFLPIDTALQAAAKANLSRRPVTGGFK